MAIPRVLLASLMFTPVLLALYSAVRSNNVSAALPAVQAKSNLDTAKAKNIDRVAAPELTETDTLRLAVPRTRNAAPLAFVQFIRNDSDGHAAVHCVRVAMRDSLARVLDTTATFNEQSCSDAPTRTVRLPARSLTSVRVVLQATSSTAPQFGHVIFRVQDDSSRKFFLLSRDIRISFAPIARGTPYAEGFVLGTLGLALTVAVLTAVFATKGTARTDNLKWDLGSSWASNVGVAGGLATALVNAAFLPEVPRYLAKPAYALLSTVFIAITALAPSVYAFAVKVGKKAQPVAVTLASAVTLWGAFGQIAIAWALFGELVHARVLPGVPAMTFQWLMIALGGLLVIYAVFSIKTLLDPPADGAAAAVGKSPYTLL